jgi:deoxyribose-phosphate aldolase
VNQPSAEQIAGLIDHTLLKPDATLDQISRICREAREYRFAAVCVNPFYLSQVCTLLKGSSVKPCAVVGFPLGAVRTADKVSEAYGVLSGGAQEVDMVLAIGALKDRNDAAVHHEIASVAEACRTADARLKVILETGLLTTEEKLRACRLCVDAGADFVKTSTGFGPGGATVDDVALMSGAVREAGLGVKASGGIRSYAEACRLIAAGATRIGTSSGIAIVREASAAQPTVRSDRIHNELYADSSLAASES